MAALVAAPFLALGGAFAASAPLAGTGMLASLYGSTAIAGAISATTASIVTQLAVGVGLTFLSNALAPKRSSSLGTGTQVTTGFGETGAMSFVLGKTFTRGELIYNGSWDDGGDNQPNEYNVQVLELSDLPATLTRVWINGEWAKLTPGQYLSDGGNNMGWAVEGYLRDGHHRLFVKYLDGTQTTADPYLLEKFGNDDEVPWTEDMVGIGIPLLIVTAGVRGDLHHQRPEAGAEIEAKGHYDRRKDSTAGGVGAQRWDRPNTWKPTSNAIVLLENVMRGIRDPYTDEFLWGSQDIDSFHLPANEWIAAMNACDPDDEGNPGFDAGLEVRVSDEPAAIAEHLLNACFGRIAEVAGQWFVKAGGFSPAVYSFTRKDVLSTQPSTFRPFKGLDQSFNGIRGMYPEPRLGWQPKDPPERQDTDAVAKNTGKENWADVEFRVVYRRAQVQRLLKGMLRDEQRRRIHVLPMPPEVKAFVPTDNFDYTSPGDGYIDKAFIVEGMRRMPSGWYMVTLREQDPDDYAWDPDEAAVDDDRTPDRPGRPTHTANFSVEPWIVEDNDGEPRAPAIKLNWSPKPGITGIRFMVRLAANQQQVVVNGGAARRESISEAAVLIANGEAVIANGEQVVYQVITDIDDGFAILSGRGILPNRAYEVNAMYEPIQGFRWLKNWLPVTTPDVRIGERDISVEVINKVNDAKERADDAAQSALQAQEDATAALAQIEGIAGDAIERLEEIVDALGGLESGEVLEIMGIARAGLIKGWAKDPTFNLWTGAVPTHWWSTGVNTWGSIVTDSILYPKALMINAPATPGAINISGDSATAGQLPGADPQAPYVTVSVLLRAFSGSLGSAFLRAEWRRSSDGMWIRGHAFGLTSPQGDLVDDWGMAIDPNRMQSREVTFKKPAGTYNAVRINFVLRASSSAQPLTLRLDYLDIRKSNQADIEAYNLGDTIDAKINTFAVTLSGPGGALAALKTEIQAEFGPAIATATSTATAAATQVEAIAGQISTLEAQFSGANVVKNPIFYDGVKAPGVKPDKWVTWSPVASVSRRASSGTGPLALAPTTYFGRLPAGTTVVSLQAAGNVKVYPGDRVNVAVAVAALTNGGNFRFGVSVRWFRENNTEISVTANERNRYLNLTDNQWRDSKDAFVTWTPLVAPEESSYCNIYVTRPFASGEIVRDVAFTMVRATVQDQLSAARVDQVAVASATANQSIASITNTVEASFDNWDAFVQAGQTAIALEDTAGSAFVIRAVAGAGSAGLRIVAWDNENSAGGAVFLDGDNIIAPGTLSAGSIVVTDLGYNRVPDNNLQSERSWNLPAGWVLLKSSNHENAQSIGEIRFPLGGTAATCDGGVFAVYPGQRLNWSFQAQRLGGTRMVMGARLVWRNKAGAVVSGPNRLSSDDTNNNFLRSYSGQIMVPDGAFQAQWRWTVDTTLTNGAVRFFSPFVTTNSDASVLITPDGAFFSQLQAESAWIINAMIANASVGTLKIGNFAVTDDVDTQRAQVVSGSGSTGNYISYDSVVVEVPNNGTRVTAQAIIETRNDTGVDLPWDYEITYGTSNTQVPGARAASNYYQSTVPLLGMVTLNAGTYTFRLRQRIHSGLQIMKTNMLISQRKR